MLVDARRGELRGPVECDVCIVGGGPAGISLALELARDDRTVCLLESGGLRHERHSQSLLAGDAVGSAYPELIETRFAMLGGATGIWAGWCRPLDADRLRAPRLGSRERLAVPSRRTAAVLCARAPIVWPRERRL